MIPLWAALPLGWVAVSFGVVAAVCRRVSRTNRRPGDCSCGACFSFDAPDRFWTAERQQALAALEASVR